MDNDNVAPPVQRKMLTAADEKAAHSMVAALTGDGKPPRAVFSSYFSIHRCTAMHLWKQIQKELESVPSTQDDGNDNILLDNHTPDAVFETKTAL